jgi:sodium transport system ATP-binding protein
MNQDVKLEARALRKEFAEVIAVQHLDLNVRPGEIVGLLGPNGAGKTTALRMLAGILTPTDGTAMVCGQDVKKDPIQARRNLGFLSGGTALYRRLTPRELLQYFGAMYEMSKSEIADRSNHIFESLDMNDFADRHCGKLSSGQQQKANIARTLLHDPEVLILDEPTNALDIVTGRFIRETLLEAKERGKAILFSTHHMDTAEYLCDRIYLLYQGVVRSSGTTDEICRACGCNSLTDSFLKLIDGSEECAGE